MEPWMIGVLVGAVLLLVVVVAWSMVARKRSDGLKRRFGPEYERAVSDQGSRRRGEADLKERSMRVARFEL